MSRASKITLVLSTALSITTIGAVYFMAENEKDVSNVILGFMEIYTNI